MGSKQRGPGASAPSKPNAKMVSKKPALDIVGEGCPGVLTPYLAEKGDWSSVPKNVKDEIFQDSQMNMAKLFGSEASTGFLIEQSLAWFTVDNNEGKDLDWYISPDPESKIGTLPAFQPSPFNRDLQEQTCEEYKHKLLREGQPQSVAGEAWLHWRDEHQRLPLLLLSYNHRAQAFYRADREFPDNSNVKSVRERGLRRCRLFAHWTPHYVLDFMSAVHNKYHKGSDASVVEICKTALRLEASFRALCDQTGLSSVNQGYGKAYEARLLETSTTLKCAT
eukprot:Skav208273  [mRNA]  locus=scaffold188:459687:461187:- [translate_table: standard]